MIMRIPEPPDGSRIRFEYWTDLYGAEKDVAGSVRAGWKPEECWLVFGGSSIPVTWDALIETYGEDAIAGAMVLVPAGTVTARVPEGYTDDGRLEWLDTFMKFGVYLAP